MTTLKGFKIIDDKVIIIEEKTNTNHTFSRENRINGIQFCLNYVRRESFWQAVGYAELALITDQPDAVNTITGLLRPYNNVETIAEHLSELEIPDGSDWVAGVEQWKNLTVKDLYERLSDDAKAKWNAIPELIELVNTGS
jgi:hypothetical protein